MEQITREAFDAMVGDGSTFRLGNLPGWTPVAAPAGVKVRPEYLRPDPKMPGHFWRPAGVAVTLDGRWCVIDQWGGAAVSPYLA